MENTHVKGLSRGFKRGYPWVVVALLWFVALLNYMDRQMLSTMKTAMEVDIVELRLATNFGHLMAVFLWVYGLMNPISGFVADRFSKKRLIVGSLFVWSLVTLLMGYATTFNQLYALRAIMGVSEALYMPAALALIVDYHSERTRSMAVGIHMTGLYAGQALGGFGAMVAERYSWNDTFFIFGFVGIAYAAVLMFFLKDSFKNEKAKITQVETSIFSGIKSFLFKKEYLVVLFCFTVFSLPGWATKNWLPTLIADSLNIGLAAAGPIATITIASSSLAGVLLGGTISDRWIAKNKKARVNIGAFGLLLMVPALFLLGFGQTLVAVILAGACFGVGFGMYDANNVPTLYQFVNVENRATAYGIMNMVGIFGGAIITDVLGGYTDQGNLGVGFSMLAFVVLIAFFVQITSLKTKNIVTHD